MRVCVTGANGFVGTHACAELRRRGHWVRALMHGSPGPLGPPASDESMRIDLKEPATLMPACEGVDAVLHLAAIARHHLNVPPQEFGAVNAEGTRCLVEAANSQGVRRMVLASSIEAVGPGPGTRPLTELDEPRPVNEYGRSKLEAERITLRADSPALRTSVARLPMLFGPGNLLNVSKLFGAVQRGIFPIIGDGSARMEFTYVENAVEGISKLLEAEGRGGEIFFVSDPSRTVREVIEAVARGIGANPKIVQIPVWLAVCTGWSWETLARMFPVKPFVVPLTGKPYFSRDTVRWTTRSLNWCSSEKFRRIFGSPGGISLEEAVARTARDFKARGWIRA